jgi:hypothetical protein
MLVLQISNVKGVFGKVRAAGKVYEKPIRRRNATANRSLPVYKEYLEGGQKQGLVTLAKEKPRRSRGKRVLTKPSRG